MSAIRFIHTADLHLDSPFKGMTGLSQAQLQQLRASTFNAFNKLIEYALTSIPHFILIVGDIYDGEDRSLHAQMKFHEGMEKLHKAAIPVYISYGNHDHLAGRWTRFELPPNVHVFEEAVGEVLLQVSGQEVVIHGFSYKERHVRDAMIDSYPVSTDKTAYHIGMLHGSLAGDVTHDVYAPFTKTQLLSKQYDYWALGHIHLRQTLHTEPPIVYPGNLQGRHRNERGEKGFYDVSLSKTDTTLTFIPTSSIVFERAEVSCVGISHANEWLKACLEVIDTTSSATGDCILELRMTDVDQHAAELFSQSPEGEWLAVVREAAAMNERHVWVQRIKFEKQIRAEAYSSTIVQSVLKTMEEWDKEDWKVVLRDVYQHTSASKYLDVLTEDEVQEVKSGAESLLGKDLAETE